MNEAIIKMVSSGEVTVEINENGIKSIKKIEPNDLSRCIGSSMIQHVSSGLLPPGCISYGQGHTGSSRICLSFQEDKADFKYYGTVYKDFPLPKLVFGFSISEEGRISGCSLGITENRDLLQPDSKMFHYPFSNVNGFSLCTGNNTFPTYKSLHSLSSLPYFILSMPNNNDRFKSNRNKHGLEMRDLLELLKDKTPDYYYSHVLIPFEGMTLNHFINETNR